MSVKSIFPIIWAIVYLIMVFATGPKSSTFSTKDAESYVVIGYVGAVISILFAIFFLWTLRLEASFMDEQKKQMLCVLPVILMIVSGVQCIVASTVSKKLKDPTNDVADTVKPLVTCTYVNAVILILFACSTGVIMYENFKRNKAADAAEIQQMRSSNPNFKSPAEFAAAPYKPNKQQRRDARRRARQIQKNSDSTLAQRRPANLSVDTVRPVQFAPTIPPRPSAPDFDEKAPSYDESSSDASTPYSNLPIRGARR